MSQEQSERLLTLMERVAKSLEMIANPPLVLGEDGCVKRFTAAEVRALYARHSEPVARSPFGD